MERALTRIGHKATDDDYALVHKWRLGRLTGLRIPAIVAVFRPPAVVAAGALLPPPDAEDVPDEPHAATTATTGAAAGSTRSIRSRFRVPVSR